MGLLKKNFLILLILCTFKSLAQGDTLHLYYDIGVYKLNKENYSIIQNKLESLNDNMSYEVEIVSSCDFLGSSKSNFKLSTKRAQTVHDLLIIKDNVSISSITFKGVGELSSNKKDANGVPMHRKTTLIFKDKTQVILDKIVKAKEGDVFVLRDIIFQPGRHYLKKESIPTLHKLLKIMQENPELEIELSGHVCCGWDKNDTLDAYDKDTKTYNLSKNRAKHIYKYLVLKKIDPSRLSHKGYGFQRPLNYPEETEHDKKMNRRVEIKVTKN